ncbi:MAG: hypothetical protein JWN76_3205 [Chitinophagaceae bacterium]|nr:hypothetical protein [Chitinophagaceae bacterium]
MRVSMLLVFLLIASFGESQVKLVVKDSTDINAPGKARKMKFKNDDELLSYIQQHHFDYMWNGAEPSSGLARVRLLFDNPEKDHDIITVGGSGFGVAGILVGIQRGFVTRKDGVDRLDRIVTFLTKAQRHHGMWPHWIRAVTGETVPFANATSKDDGGDIVESAFMMESLLCVRQFLKDGNKQEKAIAKQIDQLWREMDWDWYRNNNDFIFWHWSPNYGWEKNFPLKGYNESLMAYILGASSPTHSIPKSAYYNGFGRGGEIVNKNSLYGFPLVVKHNTGEAYVGPMFWTFFSYVGFDPRGIKDEFGINYWNVNVSQAKIQHAYCVENPKGFKGYGDNSWGFTAGYSVKGYSAHNLKNDKGVISPSAALGSFPYTPVESMKALKHYYYDMGDSLWGKYGFYDGFSETEHMVMRNYLANNQCTIAPMIENYRTGLLWKLFMSCPEVQAGLNKIGFTKDKQ